MPRTIPRWPRIWICLLGRGWEDRDGPQPCFSSVLPLHAFLFCLLFSPTACFSSDFPATVFSLIPVPSQSKPLCLQSPSRLPWKFLGFRRDRKPQLSISDPFLAISPCHVLPPSHRPPSPYDWLSGYRQRPPSCPMARQLQEPRAWVLALSSQPQRALSLLSLVSLPRAPTAAARGTPLSTTCARAPWCAGLVGSLPTRLPVAQEPRRADPSPQALLPPVSQLLEATAVWGAVGAAASGTA